MVGHKVQTNRTVVSHLSPTAKSGIHSDEESDVLHSSVAKDNTECVGGGADNVTSGLGLFNLTSSLMAAFDSWDLGRF